MSMIYVSSVILFEAIIAALFSCVYDSRKKILILSIDQNRVELTKLLLVFDLNTSENILTKINQKEQRNYKAEWQFFWLGTIIEVEG